MVDGLKKEYIDRMINDLGKDFDRYMATFDQKETHGFILNKNKLKNSSIDIEYIKKHFDAKLIFHDENIAYFLYDKEKLSTGGIYIGKDPLYHVGLYYVQEPSAAKAVYSFDIKEDDSVLDLCASPGGKSIVALCKLNESKGGFLISNEIDYNRSKILVSNIERMGFSNVIVTCNDSSRLKNEFCQFFDKIIVDAPCSGEGMMRKNIEARLQWSENLVISMSKIQKKLLDDAYYMLKVGGEILYSTCTFSKTEDEEVIYDILSKYKDLKLLMIRKIYPFEEIGEGQFYAIIKKNGEKSTNITCPSSKEISKLNILKYKVDAMENYRSIVIPTHASTHVDNMRFDCEYELDDNDVYKYIKGETLKVGNLTVNGYYKMKYKNLGLGLAKYTNGIFKNHYPKGLRRRTLYPTEVQGLIFLIFVSI